MNRPLASALNLVLPLMLLCMGGNAPARNYVAVVPTYLGDAYVYDMDEQGHLALRTRIPCGDTCSTDVSYDNRMLTMTQLHNGFDYVLFDKVGNIEFQQFVLPIYNDYLAWSCFSPQKQLFFTGTPLNLTTYRYDALTTDLLIVDKLNIPLSLADKEFSEFSQCLYFTNDPPFWTSIQGLKLASDDTYDTLTTKTITGRQSTIGLYASRDGKTLISVGSTPALKVYRVQQDGSLQWVQDWMSPVKGVVMIHFSPDDRWAFYIGDSISDQDRNIAISFAVDPDTSRLTEVQRISKEIWPYTYSPNNNDINYYTSSITPDGRFLLIPFRNTPDQISRISVFRLDGPYMIPLPLQPEIQTPDHFNSSGIAVFNTNATDPGWAQYE